jgi:hypothetical protein
MRLCCARHGMSGGELLLSHRQTRRRSQCCSHSLVPSSVWERVAAHGAHSALPPTSVSAQCPLTAWHAVHCAGRGGGPVSTLPQLTHDQTMVVQAVETMQRMDTSAATCVAPPSPSLPPSDHPLSPLSLDVPRGRAFLGVPLTAPPTTQRRDDARVWVHLQSSHSALPPTRHCSAQCPLTAWHAVHCRSN